MNSVRQSALIMPKPLPPQSPSCPHCGEGVQRIHRRLLDHLLSLLRPIRRYRCDNPACQWEGNLRWRRHRRH
jgi:hypothetical protein